ncbi:MAG: hypothetical protein AB1716_05590 [Planctomycetota bacterium]
MSKRTPKPLAPTMVIDLCDFNLQDQEVKSDLKDVRESEKTRLLYGRNMEHCLLKLDLEPEAPEGGSFVSLMATRVVGPRGTIDEVAARLTRLINEIKDAMITRESAPRLTAQRGHR